MSCLPASLVISREECRRLEPAQGHASGCAHSEPVPIVSSVQGTIRVAGQMHPSESGIAYGLSAIAGRPAVRSKHEPLG
jgi:hypothetical protein